MISRRAVVLAVTGAVLVAGAIRLYDLDRRTMSHPEFWVPRLSLPDHVQHPPPRHNASAVIENSLAGDVHPPGYHLIMLGWNGVFGTGLAAMRLSSALAGSLAVLALFFFARAAVGAPAAVLGSWMLAVHGYHVYWSQQLRPWALLSVLALVTCYLLLKLAARWHAGRATAYLLLVAVGLWTDYYFWPLVAGQILWALVNLRQEVRVRAFSLQFGAVLLAFPVFVFLRYHLTTGSHLSGDVLGHLVWLWGFGGLFDYVPVANLGDFPGGALVVLAFLAGATLWVIGLRRAPIRFEGSPDAPVRPTLGWFVAGATLSGVFVEFVLSPLISRGRVYTAALLAPFVMAVFAPPVFRRLHVFDGALDAIRAHRWLGPLVASLPAMVLVTAFALFTVVSVAGKQMFASHVMSPLVPFVLVVVAGGVVAMKKARVIIIAVVFTGFLVSGYQWHTFWHSRDYQALARGMIPLVEEGDVVLVRAEWWSEPMHYYLPPDRYSVLPPPDEATEDELVTWRAGLPDRVWLVDLNDEAVLPAIMDSLSTYLLPAYDVTTQVGAFQGAAWLMLRQTTN